ncbi:MAG: ABC transporter permease [Sarcina sp.]
MNSLLVLIKHNLNLMLWKNKSKFLISVFIPIIIIFFVSKLMLGQSSGLKIGIVNNDNSDVSKYIVTTISENKDVSVINLNESQLKSDFAQNTIQSGVVISSNFQKELLAGNTDGIQVIGRQGDSSYKLIESIINANLSNIVNLAKASKGNEVIFNSMLKQYSSSNLDINLASQQNVKQQEGASNIFIGFLMMFILSMAIFGSERIMEDKKSGIFARVLLTKTSIFKYYLANIIASLVGIAIQIIVSLIIVKNLSHINFGMPIWEMFIILIVVGVFAVSLGTISISITKNTEETGMLSTIVSLILLMLGGAFIPVSMFPETLNKVSKVLPIRWIMNTIMNVQNGSTLSSQSRYLGFVLLVSLILLFLAAFITGIKDKRVNG